MGYSSSLILILLIQGCLIGGVTGLVSGRLIRSFFKRRTAPVTNLTVGACGAIAGALCSGWYNERRPAERVGSTLLINIGQFVADHQTLTAILGSALLVLISTSILACLARRSA